jgi:hypothetical protein
MVFLPSVTLAQGPQGNPTIIQAGHFFHKDETGQCQEVKVVLELSQPEVVVRPTSTSATTSEPRERCGLFRRFHHGERATVGSFIFTPASLPLNQSAGATQTSQGASIDLSALRSVQEAEAQFAAQNARLRAQESLNQQAQGALNRLMQGFGSSAGQAGAGAGGTAPGTVSAQLETLDNRLKKLEELVLSHQRTIAYLVDQDAKRKQGPPEPIPMPKPKVEKPKDEKQKDENPKADTPDMTSNNAPEVLHSPNPVKK